VRAFSKMGVDAYLHKGSSSEELLATIRALSGHPDGGDPVVCMPRGLLERLGDGPVLGLSKRETEVLILAARGLSNRRIAAELHIAEPTVKTHLARVYRKVGAGSRTEAVRTALEEQWIGIHDVAHADGSSGG
jgi:DNA-binding NarL/FixJ family response regulator